MDVIFHIIVKYKNKQYSKKMGSPLNCNVYHGFSDFLEKYV